MFPIALLPVAGLLLGIGASFSNTQMIESFGLQNLLGEGTVLNFILIIMKRTGSIIFSNLPLIFAMGIALGMAKKEKAAAALSATISFLVMHETISSLLSLNGKLVEGIMREGSIVNFIKLSCLMLYRSLAELDLCQLSPLLYIFL